ncbi:acyl carrier protein [Streptomyces thermolineatus]|uniref:acyl carrier protein n=1 Tax=Streptomyces thermolineatus TaxID=44033 RepID=UPI00384B78DF
MPAEQFTFDDLKRLLREGAGADDGTDLDRGTLDTEFTDLGYDSLALLETSSLIERECGITFDEAEFAHATTPRGLLALVEAELNGAKSA